MKHLKTGIVLTVSAAAWLAGTAAAQPGTAGGNAAGQGQTQSNGANGNQSALAAQDRQFVIEAARNGLAEVQQGQLAARRAGRGTVRDFGIRMVQDHTATNRELLRLASAKGIRIERSLGARNEMALTQLLQLSGRTFDRMYLNEQVAAHELAVALFQTEASQGQDPDLKAFAQRTLPALQMHLDMARSMANGGRGNGHLMQQQGGTGASGTGTSGTTGTGNAASGARH